MEILSITKRKADSNNLRCLSIKTTVYILVFSEPEPVYSWLTLLCQITLIGSFASTVTVNWTHVFKSLEKPY